MAMRFSSLFFVAIAIFLLTFSSAQQPKSKNSLVFPIQGDIINDGAFFTTLYIGNPPKPYRLDIDTGSNITWVQCKAGPGSKLLKAPNAPYQPKNNAMLCKDPLCPFINQPKDYPCESPDDQCDYEVQYADHGSSLGVVVRDAFTMKFVNGSTYRPNLAFGCGYDQDFSGASAPYVDGILGLANGESSIVSQLINFGATKNVIGHCLSRQGKGFLFIGDDLLPSGLVWAPLVPNSQYENPSCYDFLQPSVLTSKYFSNGYLLGPVDFVYGGKVSSVKGINIIFDSGSTYTYLNAQVYQATLSMIKSGLGRKPLSAASDCSLPVCWKGSKPFKSIEEVKRYFSPLVLSFTKAKNVAFVLPPEDYLLISSRGNVCLGILNGANEKLGNLNIIGDISMLDKLIVYDNERRMIGWTPWNCNKVPNHLWDETVGSFNKSKS